MFHFRKSKRVLPLPTKSATIALFTGFSLIAACGAKKDSPAGKPAPKPGTADSTKQGTNPNAAAASPAGAFLKWSDFDAYVLPKEQKTDSDSVISSLSWESIFYANFPEDPESRSTDESLSAKEKADALTENKCREDLYEKSIKIEVEKDLIKFSGTIKDTCSSDRSSAADVFYSMQCVGSDLSNLKGKTFKAMEPLLQDAAEPNGICAKATEIRIFMNNKGESQDEYDLVSTVSGYSTEDSAKTDASFSLSSILYYPGDSRSVTTRVVSRNNGMKALMQPNGAPCIQKRKDNSLVLEGECWTGDAYRETEEYAPESGRKSESIVKRNLIKSKGVVEDIGSKAIWLRAGTFEVTVNEWKGTVTTSPTGAPRAILAGPSGAKIDQLIPVANSEPSDSKQSATEDNASYSSGQSDPNN